MRVITFPQASVPDAVGEQVQRLADLAWPDVAAAHDWRHDPALDPVIMVLVDEEDCVLASLAVLSKGIRHAGREFRASGLSAVVTDPDRRREGLGQRLVLTARQHIRASGADLGIFTCDRELVAFYETAGWMELAGTVLVGGTPQEPLVSGDLGKITMAAFFSPHAQAHEADFRGARVELYPGLRDKLW